MTPSRGKQRIDLGPLSEEQGYELLDAWAAEHLARSAVRALVGGVLDLVVAAGAASIRWALAGLVAPADFFATKEEKEAVREYELTQAGGPR